MKGFFLVILTIGLLIVCLLVVKNVSTHETLQGDQMRVAAVDRAKEAATMVNRQTDEMNRKLQEALGK